MISDDAVARAAALVARADALVFAAGAGMGVDSGLPDFRGNEGFWRAYPPYAALGLDFADLANPAWFRRDPGFAWGFYGHRQALYRRTVPHEGFARLLAAAARAPAFVFTSNVDGQFQRAGFSEDAIVECHGSLHHLQCLDGCGQPIFPATHADVDVDPESFRARGPLPSCPSCGGLARPNVLMFGDRGWDDARTDAQRDRLARFLAGRRGALVVVECGAGVSIPTVRAFSERLASAGAALVRIDPRACEAPVGHVGLPLGARAALCQIFP